MHEKALVACKLKGVVDEATLASIADPAHYVGEAEAVIARVRKKAAHLLA